MPSSARYVLMSACLLMLWACTDSDAAPDMGLTPLPPAPDLSPALDMRAPADMMPPAQDMREEYDGPLLLAQPRGLIWPHDPVTDAAPVAAVLPRPDDPDGALTLATHKVLLCANEDGEALFIDGQPGGAFCKEIQRARPQRGEYLHLVLPDPLTSADDSFAEVNAYYHVARVAQHFADSFGLSAGPAALTVLTNAQFRLNAMGAAKLGRQQGWNPIEGAYYVHPNGLNALGGMPRSQAFLMFGQGVQRDASYDASVIYHEFAHAIIGVEVFQESALDPYGWDNTPGAVNEALADYFAAALLAQPVIGPYLLGAPSELPARDLRELRTCPASLTGSIHADGRILSSMLWSLRQALSAEVMDRIVLGAIASATPTTGFAHFSQLLEAQAALDAPASSAAVAQAIDAWGLRDCTRARALPESFMAGVDADGAFYVPGIQDIADPLITRAAPSPLQLEVSVPAGKSLEVRWTTSSASTAGLPPVRLELGVRRDEPVGVDLESGALVLDSQHEPPQQNFVSQSITLAPGCLSAAGPTYLMWLNRFGHSTRVTHLSSRVLDAPEQGENPVTCP